MIKMDVRQENVGNIGRLQLCLVQTVKQQGNAFVGTGIDKGCDAVSNDQVTCIQQRPSVLGVDGRDAVIENAGRGARQALIPLWSFRGLRVSSNSVPGVPHRCR